MQFDGYDAHHFQKENEKCDRRCLVVYGWKKKLEFDGFESKNEKQNKNNVLPYFECQIERNSRKNNNWYEYWVVITTTGTDEKPESF